MGGSAKKVFGGMSAGAIGLAAVAIVGSLLAFNGESWLHDDKLGIQLGMMIDATTQEIFVWIHAPRALYIRAVISDVVKYDEEGVGSDGGLADLFPIGATTHGSVVITFEVFEAYEDQMPDLSSHTQPLIPMAYIRKSSAFPTALRYILLGGAHVLNYWTWVKFGILAQAILCIVLGFALRFRNKKLKAREVVEIKEELKEETS